MRGLDMVRLLAVSGAALLVLAGLVWLAQKLGLRHLPGDLVVVRPGFRFYMPLGWCLVISAALTLISWLVNRR